MGGIKHLVRSDLDLPAHAVEVAERWLRRGDGIAVYENYDMSSAGLGDRKFVSYGSSEAQLEVEESDLPERLPDIGNDINWRYQLIGVYRASLDQFREELDRG